MPGRLAPDDIPPFPRPVARRRPWLRGKPRADSYDRLRVTPTHRVTFNIRYSACAGVHYLPPFHSASDTGTPSLEASRPRI
jgi:hypothetical protein